MAFDLKDGIGVWGAFLATALAGVKLWEVFSDKPRLSADYSFSTDPQRANSIVLLNTAKTPALVNYWELTWATRLWRWTRFERFEEMPEDGRCDLTVPAHGRATITFEGQRWFATRDEIDGHRVKLFLKLYLAGRRWPVWVLIWPKTL